MQYTCFKVMIHLGHQCQRKWNLIASLYRRAVTTYRKVFKSKIVCIYNSTCLLVPRPKVCILCLRFNIIRFLISLLFLVVKIGFSSRLQIVFTFFNRANRALRFTVSFIMNRYCIYMQLLSFAYDPLSLCTTSSCFDINFD